MRGLIVKRFATDVVWAVAALIAASVMFAPGTQEVLQRTADYERVSRFLLVCIPPSVVVGILTASRLKCLGLLRMLLNAGLIAAFSSAILFLIDAAHPLTRNDFAVLMTALFFFVAVKFLASLYAKCRPLIPGVMKRVLVVGSGPMAEQMGRLAAEYPGRYVLLGQVDCPRRSDDPEAQEDVGTLMRVAKNMMADKLVVAMAERRGVFPVSEMLSCKLSGIEVLDAPSFYERVTEKLLIENITPSWFIFSSGFKVTFWTRLFKRLGDIALSLVGLLLTGPFLPLIALAIKLDSPGPVFFRQVRVGQGDRPFNIFKFRTMRNDAEAKTGAVWSQKNDPRITRLGGFLRKSRIDEIPQLFNVLRGEMSLVGPRPERPEFVEKLKERIPYYSERHYVKPGVTGWAQVRYPYGSSVEDAIEKLRYDLFYIKHISLALDLKIIIRTISVMVLGRGR